MASSSVASSSVASGADARPQHEAPYLHVRAPRRVVGVGGEGEPLAKIRGNRAGLLRLREQVDAALRADEGMASAADYRETDERRFDLFVQRAARWATPASRTRPTTPCLTDPPRPSTNPHIHPSCKFLSRPVRWRGVQSRSF